MSANLTWTALDKAGEAWATANRPAFPPRPLVFSTQTFLRSCNLPQERYNCKDSAPKKEIPVKVLVVDDHPVVRVGISTIIDTQPDMTVVAEEGSGEEAWNLLIRWAPLRNLRLGRCEHRKADTPASRIIGQREQKRSDRRPESRRCSTEADRNSGQSSGKSIRPSHACSLREPSRSAARTPR